MENQTLKYNSDLLKSTGLIQETIVLLETYEFGISKYELTKKVIDSNLLSKATNKRIKDIIYHAFYKRYFDKDENIIRNLKMLRSKYISNESFLQMLLIYTCRANLILFDFIIETYYSAFSKGYQFIDSNDPKEFIAEAIKDGRIEKQWADSTRRKVSEHIIATLIDFKLIDKSKRILPFHVSDLTVNYLIHELHFSGYSDNQILDAKEWKLFGCSKDDAIKFFERISFQGHFIFQYSGELLKISWKYNSMNECIDGITR